MSCSDHSQSNWFFCILQFSFSFTFTLIGPLFTGFSLVSSHFTSPPSCPQHPRVMDHDIPTVSTNDKLALFYYFTLTALRWSTDHDHDYDIPDVSTNWNYFTILLGWPSAPPPGPPLTLTMSIAVIRPNVRQSWVVTFVTILLLLLLLPVVNNPCELIASHCIATI